MNVLETQRDHADTCSMGGTLVEGIVSEARNCTRLVRTAARCSSSDGPRSYQKGKSVNDNQPALTGLTPKNIAELRKQILSWDIRPATFEILEPMEIDGVTLEPGTYTVPVERKPQPTVRELGQGVGGGIHPDGTPGKYTVSDWLNDACGTGITPKSLDKMRADISPENFKLQFQADPVPPPPETIVAAAIQKNGVVYSLDKPARHGDVIHDMIHTHGWPKPVPAGGQGFVTSYGRFVDRVEARKIAEKSRQPLRPGRTKFCHSTELFSEDLW
jgi:hypothetical protein